MCTKECGMTQPPDEQELVEAFEIVARDAFAFLGPEHQMRPSGLATFVLDDASRHRPVAASDLAYPFLAVLEFTGSGPPVRISYGNREYRLEVEITANGTGYHPLASWLSTLGIDNRAPDHSGVATPTALARHARRLAQGLREHLPEMREAGPDDVSRLGSHTGLTAAALNRNRDRAQAAFAAGEYQAYIELLAPFENALTVTEKRKMEFARAKRAAA